MLHIRDTAAHVNYYIKNFNFESPGTRWNVDTFPAKFSFAAGIGTGQIDGTFNINTSNADYRFTVLMLKELVGQANSGCHIAIMSCVRRRTWWGHAKVRKVVEIKADCGRKVRSAQGLGHKINIPADSVGNGQAWHNAPGVLQERSKITEEECRP